MDAVTLRTLNRALLWLLPAAVLGAGADLYAWNARWSEPLRPLPPPLEELSQPMPDVPAAGFSEGLFEQSAPRAVAAPAKAGTRVPVAVQESKWKLRGVMMAGGKRVFLEDEGGKGVWVTEGEQLGSTRVREIRERSVILEGKTGEYEIRM